MLNDMYLWERDTSRSTRSYEASLVLFADQFKDDAYYVHMLQKLLNDRRCDLVLVTPTLDINKPETPEWPGLLLDKGASWFADETSAISEEPRPQKHEAEEETPEKLPVMSDMDYCRFGDETSESSEDEDMNKPESREWPPGLLIEGGPGVESSEEPCPEKHKADAAEEEETPEKLPVYRWDPITLMYKLKSLG